MKSKTSVIRFSAIAVVVIAAALVLVSWNYQDKAFHFGDNDQFTDTVPPKKSKSDREKKVRNLDEAIEELETINIDDEMRKAMKEVEKAMKEFDAAKIQLQLEKALKDVDMKKIQEELRESLAKVDGEKIKAEVQKALSEIDFSKIKTELEQSLKEVDMDKIKAELDMEKLKEEMKNVEKELKNIGPEIEQSLEKAKLEIEKAKIELKEYKTFVDGLEKDGLMSKKEGYTIQHKNGELIINGKKQPDSVYNKYRSFLEKHKSFKIDDEADHDFNIDID